MRTRGCTSPTQCSAAQRRKVKGEATPSLLLPAPTARQAHLQAQDVSQLAQRIDVLHPYERRPHCVVQQRAQRVDQRRQRGAAARRRAGREELLKQLGLLGAGLRGGGKGAGRVAGMPAQHRGRQGKLQGENCLKQQRRC